MKPENFAYWLISQFELNNAKSFTLTQTLIIKHHAELVIKTVEINDNKEKIKSVGRPGIGSWPFPTISPKITC